MSETAVSEMYNQILHQLNRTATLKVRQLDELLNLRVATASTDQELNACMREKLAIKRHLASLPESHIEGAAAAAIEQLIWAREAQG